VGTDLIWFSINSLDNLNCRLDSLKTRYGQGLWPVSHFGSRREGRPESSESTQDF
jgi:hypothetical protein